MIETWSDILEKHLRALVDGDMAGVYRELYDREDWRCVYCDGRVMWSIGAFSHNPDCPIYQARELLEREEQRERDESELR